MLKVEDQFAAVPGLACHLVGGWLYTDQLILLVVLLYLISAFRKEWIRNSVGKMRVLGNT